MSAAIETSNLTKHYGSVRANVDVNLEVLEGEVFGYLGPNGAGKTTTIRTLLDLIRPTSGDASIFGLDAHRDSVEIRRRTGYLPGELALYDRMTGTELLTYASHLAGEVKWSYVGELGERLQANLDHKFSTLSRGNKQKIGLIQAFMHKPDLVILDEPTRGLDPLRQQEFYSLVADVKADGRTVFFSSHNLPEIERTCDRVGIIRGGRIIAVEEISTMKERALHRLEFQFAETVPQTVFAGLAGVEDVAAEDSRVTLTIKGSPDAAVKAAAKFEVTRVTSHDSSLEEICLAYYNEGESHAE